MSRITLHHGSDRIVREPSLEAAGAERDFGKGFYCTEDRDLAGEWACRSGNSGFINTYELEEDGLKILDLRIFEGADVPDDADDADDAERGEIKASDPEENLLKWLALVAANRTMPTFSEEFRDRVEWLTSEYLPRTEDCDVIIGCRADDVWLSLIRAFLSDEVSLETLKKGLAEKHGTVQYVLVSEKALAALEFIGTQVEDGAACYPRRIGRARDVRELISSKAPASSVLKDSMRTLGEAVDYAVKDCGVPLAPFLELLVASGAGESFRKSDPRVISGLSGVDLAKEILSQSGMGTGFPAPTPKLKASTEYRIGRALACYAEGTGCGLREILRIISADDLIRICGRISEDDEGEWLTAIDRLVKRRSGVSRIQLQRKASGLSQRGLAELSGVNIRTLQQYEIRSKDLSKASYSTVKALADALGCSPEDIIEIV